MNGRIWAAALAAVMLAPGAMAQAKLTVTVDGVNSSKGNVVVSLCSDPKAAFPGYCTAGNATAQATEGQTVVVFDNVKPGAYAVQIFHDENANGVPNIPPEGFAYGNNQPFPPSFDKSVVQVSGDTKTSVKMQYLNAAMMQPRMGSKGAAAPAGASRIDVRENGLYGEFYVADQRTGKLPAIVLIGGSEGGLDTMSMMAPGFVKQGYAVLVLAYFREQGLPEALENVPLEYFDKGLAWLKARPEVDAGRIGLVGGSRGSEAVLLTATRNKDVRAVMAFAPSGLSWQGLNFNNPNNGAAWTAGGKPVPYMTPDPAKYNPNAGLKPMFDAALAAGVKPEAVIPVETINAPILLISGEDDQLWPSTLLADQAVERLKAKGFRHKVEHLRYPGVGHLVFMGDPAGRTQGMAGSMGGMPIGGTPEAGLAAWRDNWPKTVKFFDDALKGQR